MTPLLTDLHAAIAEVLARHNRLDLREELLKTVTDRISDPVDDTEFITRLCALFHAAPVDA